MDYRGCEGQKVPETTEMRKVNYGLALARLKLDGFVSLDAGPARPRVSITRPVMSDIKQWLVNVRYRGGRPSRLKFSI